MGCTEIPYKPGRVDADSADLCPPNGRLPDASQGAQHLRDVFYRMGFNDQEIVALSGAHTLGHCHVDRSGYDGPWSRCVVNGPRHLPCLFCCCPPAAQLLTTPFYPQ